MSYLNVDPIVCAWAKRRGILLSQENHGSHRRFFHVSSDKGETFQFVIEPELNHSIRIDAHLIETLGNDEEHYIWETPISGLEEALETGMRTVETWFNRKVGLR